MPRSPDFIPKSLTGKSWSSTGSKRLRRVLSFDDFAQALEFTKKAGELADEEGYHPALLTEWGRTTVTWWTHRSRACIATISSWRRKRTSCISHELIRCHELIRSMDRKPGAMPGRRRGQGFWLQGAQPGTATERPLDASVLPLLPTGASCSSIQASTPPGRDRALGRSPPKDAAAEHRDRLAGRELDRAVGSCRHRVGARRFCSVPIASMAVSVWDEVPRYA
jgi:pterin-4a-carbinolamine dehydratase